MLPLSGFYGYTRVMKLILLFAGIVVCFFSSPLLAEKGRCSEYSRLTFGVLPFVSVEQLVIRFSPFVDYLSKHIGTRVRIETAPNFAEFVRRTNEDRRYDILFTAPHFYIPASQAGYRLIAGVDSPGMRALIVVPENSSINSIKDLSGKRLGILDEKSLASLLVKKLLSENGIDLQQDLTIVHTPTHNASLLSSYHGITDASALMQPPYEAANKKVRESMRVIARTEKAPHMPVSVSKKISEVCAAEIKNVLLNMALTQEGRRVLRHNRFAGFRIARQQDYEKVRSLMRSDIKK